MHRRGALGLALIEMLNAVARTPGSHTCLGELERLLRQSGAGATIVPAGPTLRQALHTFLESDRVDHQVASHLAGKQIVHDLAGPRARGEVDDAATIEHLRQDALCDLFLRRARNTNLELEVVLKRMRARLLVDWCHNGSTCGERLRLVCALAMQGELNEYVLTAAGPEREALKALKARVERDPLRPENLLHLAMYMRVDALDNAEAIAAEHGTSDVHGLGALIRSTYIEPRIEKALEPTFPSIGEPTSLIEQHVAAQYEESPYPRWTRLRDERPRSLHEYLSEGTLETPRPLGFKEPADCLVAGCGTGQQPLHLARLLPGHNFVALDVSRASLAYGQRKAREIGIENVEFIHGDLQQVERLGRSFDIIFCAGVLHHLDDPTAGLKALRRVLRPRGLMQIGVYSKRSRDAIVRLRESFPVDGKTVTLKEVRDRRSALVQDTLAQPKEEWASFYFSPDFFSLSTCRDLLYHVQEKHYTPIDVEDWLTECGLECEAVYHRNRQVLDLFRKRFPEVINSEVVDLSSWDLLDQEDPRLFSRLFTFLCRGSDTAT